MDEKQLKDAEQLYQSWSAAQLLRATTAEKQDYKSEALDLMVRELSRRGVSQSEREGAEREVVQHVEAEKKRLTGIRGFLLLFVIVVVFGSLLYALFGLLFLGAGGLFILSGVLSLILAGYGFYVFYLLTRIRRTAPQHAERFLIFGFLLSILETLVAATVTHHFDPGALGGFMGTLLWLAYLGGSKRVANTYGRVAGL